MGLPTEPVTLTPAQIEALNKKLAEMRHNVNNCLSLIVAAAELVRRRPDMLPRMLETIAQQPEKIITEVRQFSDEFEKTLTITRGR